MRTGGDNSKHHNMEKAIVIVSCPKDIPMFNTITYKLY